MDIDQPAEIVEYLLIYAKKPKGFLLLSGKNGTGKTHAALQIYHANTGFKLPAFDAEQAIFSNQTELNIKFAKASAEGWTSLLLNDFINTKLLVLDDIGTRTPSEAYMDFLYAVVDSRYFNREAKATIITTNLNSTTMREKFGDAFVSRVASNKCFRLEGKDRRFQDF